MFRPKDTTERILHRLKIAQGHLKKVSKMVEDGEYCIDIIHQSQAIQAALKEVDGLVLGNHLKGCVSDAIKSGKQNKVIPEIMDLFYNASRYKK